jgi:hypothetical protein
MNSGIFTATCINDSVYDGALTYGQKYAVLAVSDDGRTFKLRGDNGRTRWYPALRFDPTGADVPRLTSVTLRDPVDDPLTAVVEVDLMLSNGEQRWCWFVTPASFERFGDLLPGTSIRMHYDLHHTLILTELSAESINHALRTIERRGALLRCTRPICR